MITPSGPLTVVMLVVNMDYIHKGAYHSFSICPPFLCKGSAQHFIYSECDATDYAQLVLKSDLEIVL